jgi:proteasome assembly chaperone (PAC2) family protein
MANHDQLKDPWLVAVWPGMGSVALSAGYYLMSKLGMTAIGEYPAEELFDIDHVEVTDGLIRTASRPRSRLFAWRDPQEKHDVVVFIGEAQPPVGKYAFCRRLIEQATDLGVQHVFTFAAMATQMHPDTNSRVFGAATDGEGVRELQQLELELLASGQISGLNGVLLGAAAEANIRGTCLLGEIPHIFAQVPFPKASLRVLEVFATMAGIEVDFEELAEQAQVMEQRLGQVLSQIEHAMRRQTPVEEEAVSQAAPFDEGQLSAEDADRIEELFRLAMDDRSRAYELKRVLDELDVFQDYEDRFLDLFLENE